MNQPPGSHGSEQALHVPKSCNKHKIESKSMNAPSKPRNTKRERGRGRGRRRGRGRERGGFIFSKPIIMSTFFYAMDTFEL